MAIHPIYVEIFQSEPPCQALLSLTARNRGGGEDMGREVEEDVTKEGVHE